MSDIQILQPPELENDKMMAERFGFKISPKGRQERRLVFNLLERLRAEGFSVYHVSDGVEDFKVSTTVEAMNIGFSVDDFVVYVRKADGPAHYILFILGNGLDNPSDWSYTEGDPDGFAAFMDQFDPDIYA